MVGADAVSVRKGNGVSLGEWPLDGLRVFRDVPVPYSQAVSRPGLMLDTEPRVLLLLMTPNGFRCPPELLDEASRRLVEREVAVMPGASMDPGLR